jgi:hypothetical protein
MYCVAGELIFSGFLVVIFTNKGQSLKKMLEGGHTWLGTPAGVGEPISRYTGFDISVRRPLQVSTLLALVLPFQRLRYWGHQTS